MANKKHDTIEQRILIDRVDMLYARSKSAILSLLAICAVYLVVQSNQYPWQSFLVWYAVLCLVMAGRWFLKERYTKDPVRTDQLSSWLWRFRLGILATGLTVGSLPLLFFPQQAVYYLMLAIMFPLGITAGSLIMLPDFFSFFIYLMTLIMPVIYKTAMIGDHLHQGISVLVAILALFFLKFSNEFNDNLMVSLRLRYENRALVEDLEQERAKLNNRLGRILNDSSNEIYVADANTLVCLQVNMGAIQNLGYLQDEFAAIHLLDIFADLDRNTFDELIQPLRSGQQETVLYKGRNRRKDGSLYPVEARLQLSIQDSPPILVATVQDVTERSEWEEKLLYQANFDQLTGLLNRHYMQTHIKRAFIRANRQKQKVGLLFMDLDNFKHINDTLGHDTGDEVLKQTAERLRTVLRQSDTPVRSGGDEFTILLEGLEQTSHAEVVALKLINIFKQPFVIDSREVYTSVSIGISIYPDDGEAVDQLMQYADMAMYHAKDDGPGNYQFFSREMRKASEERMLVADHLRHALDNNEMSLVFQPKIDIVNGTIAGAEALLRWHNPELGHVPPDKFIPLAEDMGFIESIGTWVLEMACKEASQWQFLTSESVHVAVNISSQQFHAGTLLAAVDQALRVSGLPHHLLELEITESLILEDTHKPMASLQSLYDRGIRLAVDDFGTGYSSLSYLKRFPLQVLKIDRSFTRDLEDDSNNRALVEAIIAMAKSLQLEVVAEGVENELQLAFLRHRGVRLVQGYFFSPPVSVAEFRQLLINGTAVAQGMLCSSKDA
ncbi:MAG: EAL domain-containing protein [Deltaproteobacteria bacterium]|nr:EAL domain-containing protein [Candidatus Anaeroferrophillus wilburensis]MBN2889974.1 EAL domain-containing protein [Deltaproteobacteria bacterium]